MMIQYYACTSSNTLLNYLQIYDSSTPCINDIHHSMHEASDSIENLETLGPNKFHA